MSVNLKNKLSLNVGLILLVFIFAFVLIPLSALSNETDDIRKLPGNDVILTLDDNQQVSSDEEETRGYTDFYLTFKYSAVKNKLYVYNHGKLFYVLDLATVDLNVYDFIDNLKQKYDIGEIEFFDETNRSLDKRRIEKSYKDNYRKIKEKEELEKTLRQQLSVSITWDGEGTTNNWSEALNWSGDVVPASNDVVGFDATSAKNCTIDISISVKGFDIRSDYTGTITQNSGSSITIGSTGFEQSGGTLILSDAVSVTGHWTYVAGTLTPGSSTVTFGDASKTITGNHTLNNVTFRTDSNSNRTWTIEQSSTLTVQGSLNIQNSGTGQIKLNSGTIAVQGNITTDGKDYGGGSATVLINGAGDQSLTVNDGNRLSGSIPNININKTAGTLTLIGTIRTDRDWTYTAGTVDAGTSTVVFGNGGKTITGSHSLNNVIFDTNNDSNKSWTIEQNSTLTVLGILTLDNTLSGKIELKDGTVAAQGNIEVDDRDYGNDGTLLINGTGDQMLTVSATRTQGSLPDLNINKSSGTLTLAGTIRTEEDWTYTAGTINPGTSTVVFGDTGRTIMGSHSLNDVIFDTNNDSNKSWTIEQNSTLTVLGTLTLDNTLSGKIELKDGTVAAQGNIEVDDRDYGNDGTLLINGTGDQMLTVSATRTQGSLPDLNINKSSGTLTLAGTIRTEEDWTYTAGTINPGTSTVVFGDTGRTIMGSHSLNDVIFDTNNDSNKSWTIEQNSTLTVLGTLTLDNTLSGRIQLKDGTIAAKGNVTVDNGDYSDDATILINGTSDQTFTTSHTRTIGALPKIHINKSSGTLIFSGDFFRFGEDVTYTTGNLNLGSTTFVFGDYGGTINSSLTLNDVIFDTNSSSNRTWTVASGVTLTVNGTLTVDNSNTGTINIKTGTVAVKGNITTDETVGSNARITLTGSSDQTINISSLPTGTFTVNKTSGTATLANNLTLSNSQDLIITSGTLDQGASFNITADDLTVEANGTLKNFGTGDLTLDRNLTNNGVINIDGDGIGVHTTDPVLIRSTVDGTQRTWSGTGTFSIQDVDVKDQKATVAITAVSSTDSGNNTGFVFNSTPSDPIITSATLEGSVAATTGSYIITDGQKLIVSFQSTDSDVANTVTLSTPQVPSVGTFEVLDVANTGTAKFTFKPTVDHVRGTYTFTVKGTDNNNAASNVLAIGIKVVPTKEALDLIQAGEILQALEAAKTAAVNAGIKEEEPKQPEEEVTLPIEEEPDLDVDETPVKPNKPIFPHFPNGFSDSTGLTPDEVLPDMHKGTFIKIDKKD